MTARTDDDGDGASVPADGSVASMPSAERVVPDPSRARVPRLGTGGAPPPVAERRPVRREAHGTRWADDYAWLRAKRWERCVRDPSRLPREIRAHLEAENAHADGLFAPLAALRATLVEELRGRIDPVDVSLPDDDGPWRYVERLAEGDEHGVYARRPRDGDDDSEERVLIDFEAESEAADCFDVGSVEPSPDHAHLAWTVDTDGAELYRLRVRDAETLEDVVEIEDVGDVCWVTPRVLLYTRLDEHLRPSGVWRHVLGTDPDEDVPVYEEADPRFECSVWTSRSRAYAFLLSETSDTSEVRFVPTATPFAEPVLVEARETGHEYAVEHQGERFLILTNADGALDFRLVETPCETPGRAHWRELVAHVPGRVLLDVEAYRDWTLWSGREDALPFVRWSRVGEDAVHDFAVDEPAFSLALEPLVAADADTVRVAHSSPTTPETVFGVALASGERTVLKRERIPSGHDPARYRTARVHATSADGSAVPVTLLHLRATPLDGTAPCLLEVYGAYGDGLPAAFEAGRLPLVDRGFVVAIAHVRGGDEKGRAWYEASRFGGRERVVEDLVACGEHLVASGVCARGRICLQGASAGGLVVGAALNRAAGGGGDRTASAGETSASTAAGRDAPGQANPDGAGVGLWGAAILDVPFVDALNTMLDETLPLTPGEWSEWGNPVEDAEAFATIRRHAPYENVAEGDYPPLLVTAGIVDTRVTWWEPAKWVARLRERRANDAPLAFFTNLSTGHFGESGRYASLDEEARALAFAIAMVG